MTITAEPGNMMHSAPFIPVLYDEDENVIARTSRDFVKSRTKLQPEVSYL